MTRTTRNEKHQRRGISAVWVLLASPALLVTFCFMLNVAKLWLARVQLESALEAAALAAVKEWGTLGGGDTLSSRELGVEFAALNDVCGTALEIDDNYRMTPTATNPNQNETCDVGRADPDNNIPPSGNLIFGALRTDDPQFPLTFDSEVPGGCSPGTVFLNIEKEDGGSNVDPRMIGVFFDDGPPNLAIRSITITLPDLNPDPYFDSTQNPLVSIENVGPDELNRNNPVSPHDVRGLNPDPTAPGVPLQSSSWACPNPNGDICFEFLDPIAATRFRTLRINFPDGAFTSTGDPATTDFFRFGVSVNRLTPPMPAGDNNDGDAFGRLNVPVAVTFVNLTTMQVTTATGVFVDADENNDGDFDDGRAEALITGPGGGLPAVRAQASVSIPLLCGGLFGFDTSNYCVTAKATAVYDCATGRPRLVRVDQFICTAP